jgi:hypothetical protein
VAEASVHFSAAAIQEMILDQAQDKVQLRVQVQVQVQVPDLSVWEDPAQARDLSQAVHHSALVI